jgi:hypothetical protein
VHKKGVTLQGVKKRGEAISWIAKSGMEAPTIDFEEIIQRIKAERGLT